MMLEHNVVQHTELYNSRTTEYSSTTVVWQAYFHNGNRSGKWPADSTRCTTTVIVSAAAIPRQHDPAYNTHCRLQQPRTLTLTLTLTTHPNSADTPTCSSCVACCEPGVAGHEVLEMHTSPLSSLPNKREACRASLLCSISTRKAAHLRMSTRGPWTVGAERTQTIMVV